MNNSSALCVRAIAYLKANEPASTDSIQLSQADSPVLLDLNNGFHVAYVVDEGDQFTYIQNRHLADSGLTPIQLHQYGLENLANLAREKLRIQPYGSVFAVILDGNFEASLILIDGLWTQGVAHLVGAGFTAAIPTRDILAFCDSASLEGIHELHQVVARVSNGDHPLVSSLYQRKESGWVALAT